MDVPPQQPLEYEVSRVVGLAMQNTVYLAEMYVRQVAHYHVSPNGTGDIAEFEELKMKYGRIAGQLDETKVALSDSSEKIEQSAKELKAARAEAEQARAEAARALEAAKAETAQALEKALEEARAEAARSLELERAEAAQALEKALGLERAEAAQALEKALGLERAEAAQTLEKALGLERAEAAQTLEKALELERAEAAQTLEKALEAAKAEAEAVRQKAQFAVEREFEQTRTAYRRELKEARAAATKEAKEVRVAAAKEVAEAQDLLEAFQLKSSETQAALDSLRLEHTRLLGEKDALERRLDEIEDDHCRFISKFHMGMTTKPASRIVAFWHASYNEGADALENLKDALSSDDLDSAREAARKLREPVAQSERLVTFLQNSWPVVLELALPNSLFRSLLGTVFSRLKVMQETKESGALIHVLSVLDAWLCDVASLADAALSATEHPKVQNLALSFAEYLEIIERLDNEGSAAE